VPPYQIGHAFAAAWSVTLDALGKAHIAEVALTAYVKLVFSAPVLQHAPLHAPDGPVHRVRVVLSTDDEEASS